MDRRIVVEARVLHRVKDNEEPWLKDRLGTHGLHERCLPVTIRAPNTIPGTSVKRSRCQDMRTVDA